MSYFLFSCRVSCTWVFLLEAILSSPKKLEGTLKLSIFENFVTI